MKTKWTTRLTSLVCCVVMLCSLLSVGVSADNGLEMFYGEDVLYVSLASDMYMYCSEVPFGVNEEQLVWSVGDESVLALHKEDGYIQAIGAGETTITVSTLLGTYSDTVKVVVSDAIPMTSDSADVYLNSVHSMRTFAFVPERTGYYEFTLADSDDYVSGGVYDKNLVYTDFLYDGTSVQMVAEETYYLCISSFGDALLTNTFTLTYIGKQEPEIPEPTAIAFEKETITMAVGDIITYPAFHFVPEEAWNTYVTYSVDDDSLLLNDEEMQTLSALAPGTATVTITSENGFTDTLTVVIEDELRVLTMETPLTIDASFRDYFYADFTAPEEGDYVFYSASDAEDSYPCCRVYDADGNNLVDAGGENGFNFRAQVYLEKDQTVTLELTMVGNGQYDVYAAQPVRATGVELKIPEIMILSEREDTVYINSDYYVAPTPFFLGAPNALTESYELSAVSDTATPDEEGYYYLEAGQSVTFTVTTESGLTDSLTVVAIDLLLGDVTIDGKVDLADASALFYALNGLTEPDEEALAMMELNGDNKISIGDLARLFYYVNGLIDTL